MNQRFFSMNQIKSAYVLIVDQFPTISCDVIVSLSEHHVQYLPKVISRLPVTNPTTPNKQQQQLALPRRCIC